MDKNKRGCIHIYCGDGKGKTTAAMGLALRAAGAGWSVIVAQFLKDGQSNELKHLCLIPHVTVLSGKICAGFSNGFSDHERQITRQQHDERLIEAISLIHSCKGSPCLLVLDEIIGTINQNLVSVQLLLEFLDHKPDSVEVILTGRNPIPALLDRADYISETRKIKHPYDRGLLAREGVER